MTPEPSPGAPFPTLILDPQRQRYLHQSEFSLGKGGRRWQPWRGDSSPGEGTAALEGGTEALDGDSSPGEETAALEGGQLSAAKLAAN